MQFSPMSDESSTLENYINWEDYFMGIAVLSAQRSKDPVTQVGACIVDEQNRIVGVGYNSMPYDFPDDEAPWGKKNPNQLYNKHLYVVHAEENAIWNKNSRNLGNFKIYTTLFPCNKCAQIIIQSNIKEVFYLENKREKEEYKASEKMLEALKITLTQKKSWGEKNEKIKCIIELAKPKAESTSGSPSDSRKDYMKWEDYFMAVAVLAAERSKDPRIKVGACIVDKDDNIVGIGYNGMPKGIPDDVEYWGGKDKNDEQKKYLHVLSAVPNAILHRNSSNLQDCRVYTTLFPDHKSAHAIIQSKIKEVIYMPHKEQNEIEKMANVIMKVNNNEILPNYNKSLDKYVASRVMLKKTKIKLKLFKPKMDSGFGKFFSGN